MKSKSCSMIYKYCRGYENGKNFKESVPFIHSANIWGPFLCQNCVRHFSEPQLSLLSLKVSLRVTLLKESHSQSYLEKSAWLGSGKLRLNSWVLTPMPVGFPVQEVKLPWNRDMNDDKI